MIRKCQCAKFWYIRSQIYLTRSDLGVSRYVPFDGLAPNWKVDTLYGSYPNKCYTLNNGEWKPTSQNLQIGRRSHAASNIGDNICSDFRDIDYDACGRSRNGKHEHKKKKESSKQKPWAHNTRTSGRARAQQRSTPTAYAELVKQPCSP